MGHICNIHIIWEFKETAEDTNTDKDGQWPRTELNRLEGAVADVSFSTANLLTCLQG